MADHATIKLEDIKVGDIITIKNGSPVYHSSELFQSWVYGYKFTVIQVGKSTDKEYIVFGINGQVTGAIQYQYIETRNGKGGTSKKNTKSSDTANTKKQETSVPTKDDKDKAVQVDSSQNSNTINAYAESVQNQPTQSQSVMGTGGAMGNAVGGVEGQSGEAKLLGSSEFPSTPASKWERINFRNRKYVQNIAAKYPTYDWKTRSYDYYTNIYDPDKRLTDIRDKHNIFTAARSNAYYYESNYYNRFKIPNPNISLSSSFAHVFFVRPDLNILKRIAKTDGSSVTGNKFMLSDGAMHDAEIAVAWKNNPDMVKQLVLDNGMNHKFMLSLSNAAESFSLGDENLKTDTAGETWTGHKIAYGKHNIEGKTASQFTISYVDNRNLDIYHLNKLWMDYISKVYRGELEPRSVIYDEKTNTYPKAANGCDGKMYSYTDDKILDYATAVYYILTAEDGETIIFWSKYFGVFPTNAPSSSFSWSHGNKIHNPTFDIPYMYSFKRDYNPYDLVTFNMLSPQPSDGKYKYAKIYDPEMLGPGRTFVGVPFIETVKDSSKKSEAFQFKLRFRTREGKDINYTTDE